VNGVIDLHVHFGAPPDAESGCYWSKGFESTAAYFAMLLATESLFKRISITTVLKHFRKTINGAKRVDKVVVLAMDQVYDDSGVVHRDKTHLHVPNEYVAELCRTNDRMLFGASVHPYRGDWEGALAYCLSQRAVLCKWIPSSQLIDPMHPKCVPFYRTLAERNLPLLCHAGPEYAIPTSDASYIRYNNPKHLRMALDEGVTVIAAHCSLPYFGFLDVDYQDDFEELLTLFDEAEAKGWKLYADLSATASLFRAVDVEKVRDRIPHERLLFGSDYPVPLSELCYNRSKGFLRWITFLVKAAKIKNLLDKNYYLIKNMGFDPCVFTKAQELFAAIRYDNP